MADPSIQSAPYKKMKADKMGKWIAGEAKGQNFPFLCKDEWFAGTNGDLSNKNPESHLLQHGSSMIVIPHA